MTKFSSKKYQNSIVSYFIDYADSKKMTVFNLDQNWQSYGI